MIVVMRLLHRIMAACLNGALPEDEFLWGAARTVVNTAMLLRSGAAGPTFYTKTL